jgi:Tfp pilus assembly protein FimT
MARRDRKPDDSFLGGCVTILFVIIVIMAIMAMLAG